MNRARFTPRRDFAVAELIGDKQEMIVATALRRPRRDVKMCSFYRRENFHPGVCDLVIRAVELSVEIEVMRDDLDIDVAVVRARVCDRAVRILKNERYLLCSS